MRDVIRQCIAPLEERILKLEEGRPTGNDVAPVLEDLGLTHVKFGSAQIISLLDMLADGITPVDENVVTALLRLCEANKKFLYALAGVLEAPRPAAPQPVAEAMPAAAQTLEVQPDAPHADAPHADAAAPDAADDHAKQALAASKQGITSIRVPTERLDSLIELVGKLMVTFAVLSQSGTRGATLSASTLAELDTVITGLQNQVDAIRLVPLKQIFLPMNRLVQSLSQKMGKKVRFVISGDELALDKTIVESLNEPLVHLLRNALDHGLEGPEERAEKGKDETGSVRLTAYRKGDTAYVEVTDDGRGLNAEKILNKARERGLVEEGHEYSEQEIVQFILASGFSTAEKVTDVSGRGVGMDAVANAVRAQLGGDISIENLTGGGSRFLLSIPLSRSVNEGIVDALVCRVGPETLIVPSRDVLEIYAPRAGDLVSLPDGGETVSVRGQIFHLLRLCRHLDLDDACPDIDRGLIITVRMGELSAALLVDEVLRQQQVVVTGFTVPVQDIYTLPILGFGMMGESDALVLDIEKLLAELAAPAAPPAQA
ncbi:two-component system, chemotaxis family, sensor kinase CheA [Humidesulfovibrio mexicanus]|uniref:Chemotaxis protein CheA n=1 Tax=Humidesulfovibrio mexicanus TaxID=147047 RepID=A0A239BGT1_9BACT|nr:ATP-binding protein [Humidesulfovibrio mexicanus]SNS06842.1 two-component system, chemotaxis family, sensor kinase CheA [Humidesulfovibrio mexicanus]